MKKLKNTKINFTKLKHWFTKPAVVFLLSFLASLLFLLSFLVLSLILIFLFSLVNSPAFAYRTILPTNELSYTPPAKLVSTPYLIKPRLQNSSFAISGRDYEFVLFYSKSCHYCRRFEPILKQYASATGIPVKAFALDGGKSAYFPNSAVIAQEIVEQFFKKGAKIAVPTLFILNKNTLRTYPVSQGALTYTELSKRMDELISKIAQYEQSKKTAGENNA